MVDLRSLSGPMNACQLVCEFQIVSGGIGSYLFPRPEDEAHVEIDVLSCFWSVGRRFGAVLGVALTKLIHSLERFSPQILADFSMRR